LNPTNEKQGDENKSLLQQRRDVKFKSSIIYKMSRQKCTAAVHLDKQEPNSSVTSCNGAKEIDKIQKIMLSLSNVRKVLYKPESNLSI
jgi:hypothetical protein